MSYDKIIVVLTRPADYRKEPLSETVRKMVAMKYKKYPEFIKTMERRYMYLIRALHLVVREISLRRFMSWQRVA